MYSAWGAHAVAKQLVERYPLYFDSDDGRSEVERYRDVTGSHAGKITGSTSARGKTHFRADVILKHKGSYIDGSVVSPRDVKEPAVRGSR
jgi:hypothetical protein